MSKQPFVPPTPRIAPPSQETVDQLTVMTKEERKAFQKSDTYRKYVAPVLARHKQQKRQKCRDWWWSKGIQILNLVLALIAAITGILALVLR